MVGVGGGELRSQPKLHRRFSTTLAILQFSSGEQHDIPIPKPTPTVAASTT
ncbi:hypothetical protein [Acaryochloris thomasi]|uniref:hypothetical protein n=1 Tax=Acaryochloris thomasi TaxID=2929456 RepID=UPI001313FD7A|nr:hypothetical protein [Acaryochloris thomasi]